MTGICLGLTGGVVALERIPQKYEATATIRTEEPVAPEPGSPTHSDEMSQRLTTFKAALLRDESMAELVRRLPGRDEELPGLIGRVRNGVRVTIDESEPRGGQVIELRYRDTDAWRAAFTVNTLAEIYLDREPAETETGKPGNVGERLETAVVPTVPYSPKRLRVYGVFLMLGCLLFSGPVVARDLLHPVISTESGFGALSELAVTVSIPVVVTEQSRRSARWRLAKNVTLSVLSCAILVGAFVLTALG